MEMSVGVNETKSRGKSRVGVGAKDQVVAPILL